MFWAVQTDQPVLWRMLVGGVIWAAIGIGVPEGLRWIRGVEKEHIARTSPPPPPSPVPITTSPHTEPPKITHRPAPITKIDKFATIVPFDPTNKNVPVPMNADFQDEHSRYYSDLFGLAGRPPQQSDGNPWPNERNFDTMDSQARFLGRLLQCYILRSIDELQRDSEGIQWTAGQGSKPIVRIGIAPPDLSPYSTKAFMAEIAKTGFTRPMDQLFWKNRPVNFPLHTKLSLVEVPSSPATGVAQYIVKLERPEHFSLVLKVTQTLGPITVTGVSGASLPKGFQPAAKVDSMVGYPFIVTMNYEIQRTTEDDFMPEDYVAWANALFAGLRQRMEN